MGEKKYKRKGCYWYPINDNEYASSWNKDFSMMIVQKLIEPILINNWNPWHVIKLSTDPFDFMIRYKTPAGAKVFIGEKEMLKTVRYYVSTKGEPMKKVALPKGEIGQYKRANKLTDSFFNKVLAEVGLNVWDERIHTKNKSKYQEVVTSIESGRLIRECNIASKFDWSDVDWEYYVREIEKLIIGVQSV